MENKDLQTMRHSASHLLAAAIMELFPETKLAIGPAIENGFYYDFAFPEGIKISETDFEKIEKEMAAIVKADHPVYRQVLPRDQAADRFNKLGETYKVEIIKELPAG